MEIQLYFCIHIWKISANIRRNMSKYQQLLAGSDHLMDGLDTLSSGLPSHTIIPPGNLAELLDHVKRKLIEHFKTVIWL